MAKKTHLIPIITGPTASGKTQLAVSLAYETQATIISADSRQVYQGLDIGTGKDLEEYEYNGKKIPYELIDIVAPEESYHIERYKKDFLSVWENLQGKDQNIIHCGGSAQYLDAIYNPGVFTQIPKNIKLREQLESQEKKALQEVLKNYNLQYSVDSDSHKRLVRAIEIHDFLKNNPLPQNNLPNFQPYFFICFSDAEIRREKINKRLKQRLENGLIEEVDYFLNKGISSDRMDYLGLEYRFVNAFLAGKYNKTELEQKLATAIHQFAKRQMTWMRKIKKNYENVWFLDCGRQKSTDYTEFVLDKAEKTFRKTQRN
ncbi:MAG: tRNA (adenosine(37)-N6)-dimethylallyltransferase MiaA [Flavobacteriales bacterium]|jgi:tRNA dimethylallyltransferase|nr:tRNA (adenosine(37)-N6)-dimethylallyltransferase MiaA [Flavobacteriales bacterium]